MLGDVTRFALTSEATALRKGLEMDSLQTVPKLHHLLGVVLAEKRDYKGAAAELTAYMKLAPNAPDLAQAKDQLGQIEKLMGVTK